MDAFVTQWCNTFQNIFTFKKYIEEKSWHELSLDYISIHHCTANRGEIMFCVVNPLKVLITSRVSSARTSCEMQRMSPESTYYIFAILSCYTDGKILFYLTYVQGTELEFIKQACWRQMSSLCSHRIVGYRERECLFYIKCPAAM